ncbi:MAG: cyclic nucleotide-binding domain-containing protein [Pseudomonadota bacterium]
MFELTDMSRILVNLAAFATLLAAFAGGGRMLHVLGAVAGILMAIAFAMPMDLPWLAWGAAFAFVNLAQLVRIAHNNRRNFMTAEQRELIEQVLEVREPAQQRDLLGVISWRDAKPSEVLMWQGQKAPPLLYMAQGRAAVEHDGIELGNCLAGDFMGEMSLISGERATATVTVAEQARVAEFDRERLLHLSSEMPELRRSLDQTFNRGLTAKIRRMNEALTQS